MARVSKRRLFKGVQGAGLPSRGRPRATGSDEHSQQVQVVERLDAGEVVYFAVPNGANVSKRERAKLLAEGMQPGVTDLIILDPPPARPGVPGVALEMKRAKGGRVSARQTEWRAKFEALGWIWIVGRGADDALTQLRRLGYPV